MIFFPSFDHTGITSQFDEGMYPVCAAVVASTTKIPLPSTCSIAISFATGLHAGRVQPGAGQLTNIFGLLPLASITHIAGTPLASLLWYTILAPSGDQSGSCEFFPELV